MECFEKYVQVPKNRRFNRDQLAELIYKLRTSEIDKGDCGRQLTAFYNDIRNGLNAKRVR